MVEPLVYFSAVVLSSLLGVMLGVGVYRAIRFIREALGIK